MADSSSRVGQYALEVLLPYTAPSPTTPTGAGVTQDAIEVLLSFSGSARASQHAIEVLLPYTAPSPTAITGAGVTQYALEVLLQTTPTSPPEPPAGAGRSFAVFVG